MNIYVWAHTPGNLYCGRKHSILGDNGLGNKFRVSEHGRTCAVESFREHCIPRILANDELMTKLRNVVNLGCMCDPNQICHIDELLKIC